MQKNMRQIYAIKKANEERILQSNSHVPNSSGIYILTREENGYKYSYVGQATKNILGRLADHLRGYQHIDLSIRKHGLFLPDNPTGWKISFKTCLASQCDTLEQEYILKAHQNGYQLYNHTTGSQSEGKQALGENNRKGYRQGVEYGRKQASKEVANLFEKHLNYSQKSNKPNKNQEKAIEKFKAFLELHKQSE